MAAMKPHIAVIIPTRSRPQTFARCAESAIATATGPITIHAGVDHDDPAMDEYLEIATPLLRTHVHSYPESGCTPKLVDWLWRRVEFDICVVCGDDAIFRTQGWDAKATELLQADPLLMISPNDGRNRKKLELLICTRQWPEAVGHLLHPAFEHFCADEWVERIATRAGKIHYAMDIVLEHMHPKYGKGQWDETYYSKRRNGGNDRDIQRLDGMQICGAIDEAATHIREAVSIGPAAEAA